MSQRTVSQPSNRSPTVSNLASDLKPVGETAAKVKPCCVCKDEKAQRDECMLFSADEGSERGECKTYVDRYRECMRGYGFSLPSGAPA